MSKTLSDEEIDRIKQMFSELLARDLSPEEQRYLGLSSKVVSIHELELCKPEKDRRRLKRVNEG